MSEAENRPEGGAAAAEWLPQALFSVLLALALIRPFGRDDLYLPLSLAVLGGGGGVFAFYRRAELAAAGRWLGRRWPAALLAWLVAGVTFSMVVSVQRVGVGEWATLIDFVYSKYAVLALFPLLVAAFSRRLVAAPWGVLAVVAGVQLIGFLAYLGVDWAGTALTWSRGAEWNHPGARMAGLFDNPTVYGAISALFALFVPAWYRIHGARLERARAARVAAVVVTLFSLVGVFASLSLTALAAVCAGALAWLLNGTLRPRYLAAGLVALVVVVHVMGALHFSFSERMARNLPYFEDLYDGRLPEWERFKPKFRYDNHRNPFYWATHGRWDAWRNAFELWRERPLTGIGLGQFRLRSGGEARDENPHNLYIQVLAENGLISFVPFVLLLFYLGWRLLFTPWLGLFGGLVVMQLGNNFFDYSLPWVVCVAWVGAYLAHPPPLPGGAGAAATESHGCPPEEGARILTARPLG